MTTTSENPNTQKEYSTTQKLVLSSEINDTELNIEQKYFYNLKEKNALSFSIELDSKPSSSVNKLSKYIENTLRQEAMHEL